MNDTGPRFGAGLMSYLSPAQLADLADALDRMSRSHG